MDIAPYWLTFIKDRINLKIPIKDLVSFQKCKFILDDEHVFGSDSRMKIAMKACDHIVYQYHNKNFRKPKINTQYRQKKNALILFRIRLSQVCSTSAYCIRRWTNHPTRSISDSIYWNCLPPIHYRIREKRSIWCWNPVFDTVPAGNNTISK